MVGFLYDRRSRCVLNSFRRYRARLDVCNERIRDKRSTTHVSPNVGTVPANLRYDCGYLNGAAHYASHPFDGVGDIRSVQSLLYNRRKRRRMLSWLGLAFPDGVMALDQLNRSPARASYSTLFSHPWLKVASPPRPHRSDVGSIIENLVCSGAQGRRTVSYPPARFPHYYELDR